MRHDHILQTIGRTPAVRLTHMAPAHVAVYVKLEAFNPMGSVKDRMALAVIEDAEARGELRPGQTVVEATSGNTGIGLAMVCAQKGYPLVIVMAENFSIERRRLMRFMGARVVLTPAALKGSGMIAKARELAQAHGWFMPCQFDNEANARAHEQTTAQEILADFADAPLTHWVTGSGTGGTLRGVARVLRKHSPQTRIVVCEPDNAPVLASGTQPHVSDGSTSHPEFRPHLMQGWTPDFIPTHTGRALSDGLIDQVCPVDGARALAVARELARREGILAGITGGATLAGALELAQGLPAGSRVLAMLPDTGERYLSTVLFADIEAHMDEDEWRISRSTASARFDTVNPPPTTTAPAPAPAPATEVARQQLQQTLGDPATPVVMYALKWCEFCWSLRHFFRRIGVDLHVVELDDPKWQAEAMGTQLRAALHEHTGQTTIPQVFVCGQWLGGCMDTLAAWDNGTLQTLLEQAGVGIADVAPFDTRSLLPAWIQQRAA
ncbi:cysteine synthase [Hydrogenophaga sp.]|uniref:cysteine synthase n=1 Tax=Hydrogenophaga sp. TaxID=1904254 RepID=UPI00351EE254